MNLETADFGAADRGTFRVPQPSKETKNRHVVRTAARDEGAEAQDKTPAPPERCAQCTQRAIRDFYTHNLTEFSVVRRSNSRSSEDESVATTQKKVWDSKSTAGADRPNRGGDSDEKSADDPINSGDGADAKLAIISPWGTDWGRNCAQIVQNTVENGSNA